LFAWKWVVCQPLLPPPLLLPLTEASPSKGRGCSSSKGGGTAAGSSSSSEAQPSSADLLTRAILLYPEAVVRMQRVLQGKGVGREAEWAAVLSRPLFAGASDGGSASLSHLLDIWVERQHLLWKVGGCAAGDVGPRLIMCLYVRAEWGQAVTMPEAHRVLAAWAPAANLSLSDSNVRLCLWGAGFASGCCAVSDCLSF
jgi:hypothetical protein